MSKRRKFSPEFKQGAIEQVHQPGVSCTQVARELGIGANLLSRWKREAEGPKASKPLAELAVSQGDTIIPHNRNLLEFLEHGIQYAFVPDTCGPGRGMPTAHAAPPFNQEFSETELPPVWPDPDGDIRGLAFSPLYKSVPAAARADPDLYELLALVDCIRAGRAREKNWAIKELSNRINSNAPNSKS